MRVDGRNTARDNARLVSQATHCVFLSAMRHYRDAPGRGRLRFITRSWLRYPADDLAQTFSQREYRLSAAATRAMIIAEPGDYRVRAEISGAASALGIPIDIRPDRTFLCSTDEFAIYAGDHKGLLLENFYRWMRKRHRILLDNDGAPIGVIGISTGTIAKASAAPALATFARRQHLNRTKRPKTSMR